MNKEQFNLNQSGDSNNQPLNVNQQVIQQVNQNTNQPYSQNIQQPTENYSNNKLSNIKRIVIFVLLFIVLIIGGFIIINKISSPSDDTSKYNIIIKETKDFDIKTYVSSANRQLIVEVKNRSGGIIVGGHINVSYYDENGKKISNSLYHSHTYNMFVNGSKIFYGFELVTDNHKDYYLPAKTEIEVTIDDYYQEMMSEKEANYQDNFSYSHSIENNKLKVIAKNNGTDPKNAPRELSAVFYKDNKPIYSKSISFFKKVDPGQTDSYETNLPIDHEKSIKAGKDIPLEFDSYELYRILD